MSSTTPQFGKAEYAAAPGNNTCRFCKQPLGQRYYRVNGAAACSACGEKVKSAAPRDSHAAFVRGILFGIGGFAVGLAGYAAFEIMTGITIGYLALAVGWVVAKAILIGSGGIRGRRYQLAAVALTYAAVSIAAIPVALSVRSSLPSHAPQAQPQVSQPSADSSTPSPEQPSSNQPAVQPQQLSVGGFAASLGRWALIGLASPFLVLSDGPGGFIGLIILFVGLRIAWRMTASANVAVLGPFENTGSAPA